VDSRESFLDHPRFWLVRYRLSVSVCSHAFLGAGFGTDFDRPRASSSSAIVEQGYLQELLERQGEYYELYMTQFAGLAT